MKKSSIWVVLALSCIIIGCASAPLTPSLIPLGQHDLTLVKSRKPISLISAQEIKQTEIALNHIIAKVDLDSCCEQTINLLGQWLEYNSIPIDKNANKKLYVSVLNPKANERGNISFDLKIETASGLVKIFNTEAIAFGAERAIGYAINWGVVQVIHDADILYYMEQ
jgi:hypothetical protein